MSTWEKAREEKAKDDESPRPFRLWNPSAASAGKANGGDFCRWRYYSHLRNAHLGALIECRWADVGTTIEVIDIRTHKQWGSYTRRLEDIRFLGGDNIPSKMA